MQLHEFDTFSLTSLGLILAGAIIMAVNIFMFRRLMKQLKLFDTGTYSGIRRYSLPPLVFMIFFLAGYLFVIFSILTSLNFMGILLVGLIFFFGAVFVLITTKFQTETVAHLQESQIRLKHEALHDPLTELPNRRLILDRLSQAIERSLRKTGTFYSVMFIDLDRFKIVNDSLGHTTGDELLVEVGKRLVACVRGFDTVSRFGGDEFVVLLDGANPRKTIKVLKRIRKSLAAPFSVQKHNLTVTASYGIFYGPSKQDTSERVLQNANLALHKAKKMGLNRFKVFKSAMLDHALNSLALEHDLLRGIRNEEFITYYQPIVTLDDPPCLSGFEALVRWNHPTRGLVQPLEFIPLAEETGLIIEIGKLVFAQACAMLGRLRTDLPEAAKMRMSVNLSMLQLTQSFFDKQFIGISEDCNLQPNAITLEVTESLVMDQPEMSIGRITRLRAQGFCIAIDDFGTGYSSFAYLKDLPATHIKIDRAFIRTLAQSSSDQEIVKSMIMMGHSLHMAVVAEGIEELEQLEILRDLGCDFVQGFHYSRPLPPYEVAGFIRTFTKRFGTDTAAEG